MTQTNRLDRREFTLRSLLAMLAGVTITVSGCSSGSSPSAPSSSGSSSGSTGGSTTDGKTATISANHGHVATITSAQLGAGGAVTLDIQGMADHTHSVQLSATEVGQIAAGQRVAKTSSNTIAHDHVVTFN